MPTYVPNLKKLREQRGLKRQELANRIDVDYTTISRWERSETESQGPNSQNFQVLCRELQCRPEELNPALKLNTHFTVAEEKNKYGSSDEKLPEPLLVIWHNWSWLSSTHHRMLDMIAEEAKQKKANNDCSEAETA